MNDLCQGDIVKISGFERAFFVVLSKNAFIRSLGVFHVIPLLPGVPEGPLHIPVTGKSGTQGTVICEQVKLIDPSVRAINRTDSLRYEDIMNISDAVQGMFEYA